MIQSLNALRSECAGGARTLAVAVAQDTEVLLAVEAARKLGLAKAILVGVASEIEELAKKHDIPLQEYKVIDVEDKTEACRTAVKLVRDGEADVLVCTPIIETGIDIANVNTLIIEDADKMGLAQLHQIRQFVADGGRRDLPIHLCGDDLGTHRLCGFDVVLHHDFQYLLFACGKFHSHLPIKKLRLALFSPEC